MISFIGLGNPGEKYKRTRHNVGFMVMEELAQRWRAGEFSFDKYANADIVRASQAGKEVQLVKPMTFMNKSGETISYLSKDMADISRELLVVHDDVDLPLGRTQLVFNRGSGGHRGVRSIMNTLDTKAFVRLRVGISPTDETGSVIKQKSADKGVNPFVMGKFNQEELQNLEDAFPRIAEGLSTFIKKGSGPAMNVIN